MDNIGWDANGSPVVEEPKRRCESCHTTKTNKWHEHTVVKEDPYSVMCNEPGAYSEIEFIIYVCDECETEHQREMDKIWK